MPGVAGSFRVDGLLLITRQAMELFRHHVAIALMFGVQSVDLRTKKIKGTCDASKTLSEKTRLLYDAVRKVLSRPADKNKPYIFNDHEQCLDEHIELIVQEFPTKAKSSARSRPFAIRSTGSRPTGFSANSKFPAAPAYNKFPAAPAYNSTALIQKGRH